MSEQGGVEKKHPASQKKLQDLRREGRWYFSKELNVAALLGVFALFWNLELGPLADRFLEFARAAWDPRRLASTDPFRETAVLFSHSFSMAATILTVLLIALFCVSYLAAFLQVGAMFSVKPLMNAQKLNPVKGFQGIFFRGRTYQRAAIGIAKAVLMLTLVAFTVNSAIENLILSSRIGLLATVKVFNGALTAYLWQAAMGLALFGFADYLIERREFQNEHKMTDEEAKKEEREEKGSPEIKAHRRGQQILAALDAGKGRRVVK